MKVNPEPLKGFLLWRIPGMEAQAWALHPENGRRPRVVFADFSGNKENRFFARGPVSPSEVFEHPLLNEDQRADIEGTAGEEREDHIARVEQSIELIKERNLRKVVISRREVMEVRIDPKSVFDKLSTSYPQALVYLFVTQDECWMGATPEVLLTTDESHLKTMALAGTRRADGPPWSEKEYDEQAAVREYIVDTLLNMGCEKVDSHTLENHSAGPVEHLLTRIEATLPESGEPEDWARRLHPTPAVCGMPTAAAMQIVREVENYDRGRYCGYLGMATDESARYYVNLRCMQVGRKSVALYAGGGITAQSDPHSEWEETRHKLETIKAVLRTEST